MEVILWNALGTVITGLVAYFLKKGTDYVDTKTTILKSQADMQKIENIINHVVADVNQTFVGALKAKSSDGKLTEEERSEAFEKSYDKAKEILSGEGVEVAEELLNTVIESTVRKLSDQEVKPAIINSVKWDGSALNK